MPEVNLVAVCLIAFVAVMLVLAFLAGSMVLLARLFPPPVKTAGDPTLAAAIQAVVHASWPGTRVTRIEEKRR